MSLIKSYGVNRDRKIYGNCQVLSPEGLLMFRCDEKKVNWYLKRNLGEVLSDNPITIKLKFNPKGLGNHNKVFGLSEMGNKCVSCGTEEYLTRHHVVPHCYRKHFPVELKSHNFHDVLSLCVNCHESYERKADELKRSLCETYSAPINGEAESNRELLKFIKFANTLLIENNSKIPKKRIDMIKDELKKYLGVKRLTKKMLLDLSKTKQTIIKKTHGQIVINKVNDIQKFVEMWREHFITNIDCKHLPKNWNVKNKICLTKI
jgi:hypothetical protein